MTNYPGLVSESCHDSTFKLIRHHHFNDVLFQSGQLGHSTNCGECHVNMHTNVQTYLNDDRLYFENHRSGHNTLLSGSGTSNRLKSGSSKYHVTVPMLGWSRDVSWCSVNTVLSQHSSSSCEIVFISQIQYYCWMICIWNKVSRCVDSNLSWCPHLVECNVWGIEPPTE